MYWFVHLGVTTEVNPWDAYSPGRLDQHLIRFYEKDQSDGILNSDQAKELLECLWIKFNNQPRITSYNVCYTKLLRLGHAHRHPGFLQVPKR